MHNTDCYDTDTHIIRDSSVYNVYKQVWGMESFEQKISKSQDSSWAVPLTQSLVLDDTLMTVGTFLHHQQGQLNHTIPFEHYSSDRWRNY